MLGGLRFALGSLTIVPKATTFLPSEEATSFFFVSLQITCFTQVDSMQLERELVSEKSEMINIC